MKAAGLVASECFEPASMTPGDAGPVQPGLEVLLVDTALEQGTLECLREQLLRVCGLLTVSSSPACAHLLCCALVDGDISPSAAKLQVQPSAQPLRNLVAHCPHLLDSSRGATQVLFGPGAFAPKACHNGLRQLKASRSAMEEPSSERHCASRCRLLMHAALFASTSR